MRTVLSARRIRYHARTASVPVVLTRAEMRALLAHVSPPYRLIADLIYGSGLRLLDPYACG